MENGSYRLQDLKQYFKNRDNYTPEEREDIRTYFKNATLEQKEFTPLPETKRCDLSPVQREKMLMEARKQINRELRQVRNQIKRSK